MGIATTWLRILVVASTYDTSEHIPSVSLVYSLMLLPCFERKRLQPSSREEGRLAGREIRV
ncbi:hypothetical protein AT01_2871 [Yersinia aldovae 670-83]|nr:hypothetical protein AT01_2871 [Yersinia aldovae 670-83]